MVGPALKRVAGTRPAGGLHGRTPRRCRAGGDAGEDRPQRCCRYGIAGPHRTVPPDARQDGMWPCRAHRTGGVGPAGPDALRPREPDPRRAADLRPGHRQGTETARQASGRDRRRATGRRARTRGPGGKPAHHAGKHGGADCSDRPWSGRGPWAPAVGSAPSPELGPSLRSQTGRASTAKHGSRDVGAAFGLTPRRYGSGQMNRSGSIAPCGDSTVRTLPYEAASVLLVTIGRISDLRGQSLAIARRDRFKKANLGRPLRQLPRLSSPLLPTVAVSILVTDGGGTLGDRLSRQFPCELFDSILIYL